MRKATIYLHPETVANTGVGGVSQVIQVEGPNLNVIVSGDKSIVIVGAYAPEGMARTARIAPGCWIWYTMDYPAGEEPQS